MKRTFIALFAVAFSTFFSQAQPGIQFLHNEYDYDTIAQNSNGVYLFEFTNTGSEPLIISHTSTSCGCTTVSYTTTPVLPGDKGTVTVKYNTSIVGPFRRTIVVKSNAKNNPTIVLRIKGYVKAKKKH